MELTDEIREKRKPEYEIQSLILNRWSPRAMTGEGIPDEELMALFEAARWAPSAYNSQVWRFIYAKRETKNWDKFFNLLGEFNREWCRNAAVLIVIASRKNFEYNNRPSPTHAFDTGAAWENLALEGTARGLVVHGMSGFDYEKAKEVLEVPDDYEIMAMVAVGKKGSKGELSEKMQKMEGPSTRRPLEEIVMEGRYKK